MLILINPKPVDNIVTMGFYHKIYSRIFVYLKDKFTKRCLSLWMEMYLRLLYQIIYFM
ncbi:hypothetical protein MBAV_001622 [Candidatus Magnetobacterium bavaricum]|uniref:Uncharacterized protein n=1 Tax=Candidatus Magnetobacterium bavaricum TaxID=29290 RepID=A0A0F3GWB7_9BACT|nr:hypothetical protein MBAV_001622 [Candidatus Magnetobacterium bavaricum]